MAEDEFSTRLGRISAHQFQAALDRFELGRFVRARPIPFGLFGQNVFVTSTAGEFVLRGAAHYDWQFPKEQFVAGLLHARTAVPAPWPYLVTGDESVFGWPWGYAVMPRMPGLQLADQAVTQAMGSSDRTEIAGVLGRTLSEVHAVTWHHAGAYDLAARTVEPFADGEFPEWLVRELRDLMETSIGHGTGASDRDRTWLGEMVDRSAEAVRVPCTPTLVLHDFREGNLTVERRAGRWRVSGVFDLMEAVFGDPELDLVRQLSVYLEAQRDACARAFLAGYRTQRPLRAGAGRRLALFTAYDRMVVWEFFHRPEQVHRWPYPEQTPREWIDRYLARLGDVLG